MKPHSTHNFAIEQVLDGEGPETYDGDYQVCSQCHCFEDDPEAIERCVSAPYLGPQYVPASREPWRMHWIGRITSKKNRPRISVNKKTGKPHFRQSARAVEQGKQLHWLALKNRPDKPLTPPLALRIVAKFRVPKTGPGAAGVVGEHIGAKVGGIPDGAGILALIADALEGAIYTDDAVLGIELVERRWSMTDQVTIEVGEIYEAAE